MVWHSQRLAGTHAVLHVLNLSCPASCQASCVSAALVCDAQLVLVHVHVARSRTIMPLYIHQHEQVKTSHTRKGHATSDTSSVHVVRPSQLLPAPQLLQQRSPPRPRLAHHLLTCPSQRLRQLWCWHRLHPPPPQQLTPAVSRVTNCDSAKVANVVSSVAHHHRLQKD